MNIHVDLPRIPKSRGKKNRPGDADWKQQKLRAYRPLLTFRCTLPILTVLSGVLIAGGGLLYKSALSAQEGIIDYTNCTNTSIYISQIRDPDPPFPFPRNSIPYELREIEEFGENNQTKVCVYNLYLENSFTGNVTFYYGLTGYFQNMRQYFRSRNDEQLLGMNLNETTDCQPYDYKNESGMFIPYVPCGAVANSLFNDSFELYYVDIDNPRNMTLVPWTSKDILPEAIRKRKFKNPPHTGDGESLCDAFNNTATPPNWSRPICEVGDEDTMFGLENFDLIQWMTTSALPDFRKTYRRLSKNSEMFKDGLPAGNYTLKIYYNYPVISYGSTKRFIISVGGWLGPKNYFISFVYLATGLIRGLFSAFMAVAEFCPHSPLNRFLDYYSDRLKEGACCIKL